MPIENIKRGKHIVELKPGYSIFKEVTAPQCGAFGTKDLNGANFCMGWSLITQPFLMVDESHSHDFEQFIFLMGGNSANIVDFDAEVEMTLGDTKYLINYPACIHITPGLMHGPLNIIKVNKPFAFMDIVLNSTPSIRQPPPGSRR
ncbi:MAG TPA: hypothetical protein VF318_04910 [Dehalococcoidales bacterium]